MVGNVYEATKSKFTTSMSANTKIIRGDLPGSIDRFKGLTQSGEQLNGRFAVVTGYVGGGRGGGEEEEEEEGEDEDEEEEKDQEDAGLATASSIL
jgi:hypothetical protein